MCGSARRRIVTSLASPSQPSSMTPSVDLDRTTQPPCLVFERAGSSPSVRVGQVPHGTVAPTRARGARCFA